MKHTFFYIIMFLALPVSAQDDLDALLDAELAGHTDYAMGTFYTTRILNGQSVQMMPKNGLDFRVHHRFDDFNTGYNHFWGIDGSSSYLSLEYGFTNDIMFGFGRQNNAYFNGFAKYALLKQCKGAKNMPVTVVLVSTVGADAYNYENNKQKNENFSARFNYTHQVLIARMFSPKLSLQVSPTFVHRNMVLNTDHNNDLFGCGLGGRYKITNTLSVNAEYYYIVGNKDLPERNRVRYYDPLSVGFDIQVSAHVFQIMITNTKGMIEHSMYGETVGDIANGDIRLGFNISQVFTLGRKN